MVRQRKIDVILVGDTHPEMLALAEELHLNKVDFRIFLSFYLKNGEFQKISKIPLVNEKMRKFLSKRILSLNLESKSIIRDFAFLELFLKSLDVVRLVLVKNFASNIASKIRQCILSIYLFIVKPKVVIIYDNWNPRIPRSSKLIVIALMAHPLEVQNAIRQAKMDYPKWPKTSGNLNYHHSDIYEKATQIFVLSNYASSSFIRNGIPLAKLKTINIGPKNGRTLAIDNSVNKRQKKTKVLFVGQINLRKGVPAIISAASELQRTHDFKIVGPRMNSNLSNYLHKSNLPNNIFIVENPTPQRLDFEFLEAEVFVFPSYSEGFSLSCIEAMSYGLIPVISKNSGVSDALRNTILEKFLIDPGSTHDIVEKLTIIQELTNEDFYNLRKISTQISKNYSLNRFAREVLTAIDLI